MHSSLAFFVDRGMGSRVVPEGLRSAGWRVTTMDERYGLEESQKLGDADWIDDASRRGEILLCKDRKIAKRPLEAAAIIAGRSRVLVITDAQITGQEMLKRLLDNDARIEKRRKGRVDHGSSAQLAQRAHVTREWVVRLEGGKPSVQMDRVFDLLRALDVEVLLQAKRD